MGTAQGDPPRLLVAAGLVWLSPQRVLLQRRPPDAAHGAGMLEFPGGKVERGEAPVDALRRELFEEWGPAASTLTVRHIAEVLHHVYPPPGPEVVLLVFHVDGATWVGDEGAAAVLEPGATLCAYEAASLPEDAFLAADRPFARRIVRGLVRMG